MASMPRVTIKTGMVGADGQEEVLTEYLCDWPDCANAAVLLVDVPAVLRARCIVCREHAAMLEKRAPEPETD